MFLKHRKLAFFGEEGAEAAEYVDILVFEKSRRLLFESDMVFDLDATEVSLIPRGSSRSNSALL